MWFPIMMGVLAITGFGFGKTIIRHSPEVTGADLKPMMSQWQKSSFDLKPCIGKGCPTLEQ